MQVLLVKEWNRDKKWHDVEDVLRAAAVDRDLDEIITKCLEFESMRQILNGKFSHLYCLFEKDLE